jgi:hypothetical protein
MKKFPNRQNDKTAGSFKKNYRSPQLQIYGELRKITRTIGFAGRPDGNDCSIQDRNCRTNV